MSKQGGPPKVFMMDLWATVPYYTAYLSKALLAQGVPLTVGSISYYLDLDCFTSRGIQLRPGLMDVVGKLQLPRLPRRVFKMLEAILNLSALSVRFLISPPDVVHVQYLPMLKWRLPLDFWFLEFCRGRGAVIVLTVHDLLPHDTAEAHRRTFQKLYAMVDGMICHSDHVKARLAEEFSIPGQNVAVIPHGPFFYDLPARNNEESRQELEIAPDDAIVLWQGIIFPYKGIDLLLDAWQKVERSGSSAWLIIAGTGAPELLAKIQDQLVQLELKRVKLQLRFISTEELVDLYRTADIVVYPYRAITTSGALATGLALGKTVLASNLPAFRELLKNGESALLVDPQNTDELAGALIDLIQKPELRERLAACVRAMNFGDSSWISIAQKTVQAYESFLSKVAVKNR
jgi:glycosyltransferase involved in cell wall biosynthesis